MGRKGEECVVENTARRPSRAGSWGGGLGGVKRRAHIGMVLFALAFVIQGVLWGVGVVTGGWRGWVGVRVTHCCRGLRLAGWLLKGMHGRWEAR